MDWHKHFEKVFFESWQNAGFGYPQDYVSKYIEIREHSDSKSDWIKNSPAISATIDGSQLYSVYGFGACTGKIFAEMLGSSKSITENTADWCGRFNLGISLFDYVCDETDNLNNVSSLKVFEPFRTSNDLVSKALSPAEELLSRIAGSVLNDLAYKLEKKDGRQETDILFKVIKQMFDAQNLLSKEQLSTSTDLDNIKKALYLKSAEPFRVMAEYIARLTDPNDELLIKKSQAIGKALGTCYWVIDDAKDVWIDLEEGQWNYFLYLAAKEDPLIFEMNRNEDIKNSLISIWQQEGHAEKISAQIVERLIQASKELGLTEEVQKHSFGLIAASLWQWYSY